VAFIWRWFQKNFESDVGAQASISALKHQRQLKGFLHCQVFWVGARALGVALKRQKSETVDLLINALALECQSRVGFKNSAEVVSFHTKSLFLFSVYAIHLVFSLKIFQKSSNSPSLCQFLNHHHHHVQVTTYIVHCSYKFVLLGFSVSDKMVH
jgi:hypothetical protein